MGQDLAVKDRRGTIVHYKWMGSYSTFYAFQVAWARHLGFDLDAMRGSRDIQAWYRLPIESFFAQDCDGMIVWEEAEEVLHQARKDAPKLPKYKHEFRVLIEACQQAVKHKTPLIFW